MCLEPMINQNVELFAADVGNTLLDFKLLVARWLDQFTF